MSSRTGNRWSKLYPPVSGLNLSPKYCPFTLGRDLELFIWGISFSDTSHVSTNIIL